ncbi:tripartite tricarboxylate transporter TctB family protein [Acuticoccus sp. I52.16.1]|uniref:tripartite tricarboxylate transporter TctB family protein n=1 Tax=Acuticoccus sp. I52.16.1 TaxID=2928472 RepID=UPI001FD269D2|nr:tripartite tricarboxylate transporter TctB family protein [Acuticoccus sp. I52.16.1]UOM33280.1 tripartite tricarboxylate transporter TctB family protein [Acuticoccus sp. I52.16.1]
MTLIVDRPRQQWLCALAIVLFGAFVVWEGLHYSLGTGFQLGPGAFPVGTGAILMLLGVGVLLEPTSADDEAVPRLRPVLAVGAGIIAWSYLVDRYGLYPATFALVGLSALGGRDLGPVAASAIALVLCVGGQLIFIQGLGLPLDAFKW